MYVFGLGTFICIWVGDIHIYLSWGHSYIFGLTFICEVGLGGVDGLSGVRWGGWVMWG